MNKTVTITVTNDLLTDGRVYKTAVFLATKGFKVKIYGRKLQKHYPNLYNNNNIKVFRYRLPFNKGKLFYIYYNILLLFVLFFSKKDILLAVDLDTILPNFIVSKLQKKKLIFDSHEYFTELPELQNRPFTKKIWQILENFILKKIKHCYTVSYSIAKEYEKKYKLKCEVVLNTPLKPKIENLDSHYLINIPKNKKILIYQGVLNVGRNIDVMIEATKFLNDYILLIIGEGDLSLKLKTLAKQQNILNKKVFFLGRIPYNQLYTITKKAHIGLSLEKALGKNYLYALPNKLFDYIMAQVPQIASSLPEMSKIIFKYKTGKILNEITPQNLSTLIKNITNDEYNKMKENCYKASQQLNWENESKKLERFFLF